MKKVLVEKTGFLEKKDLSNILLAVALVMGFIFIVSLLVYFIESRQGILCDCRALLPIIIAILTSAGVFVGILTYYFLSKSFYREKKKIYGDIEKTLNFLEKDEKKILSALIENKGVLSQNKLGNLTSLSSVKLHRRLSDLESKNVLYKVKNGMTNKVILKDDFKEIFIK